MRSITDIMKEISVLNAESKRLNDERQVNIGRKETLNQQLNSAIAHYNKTYGTNITAETVDAEAERVMAIKEKEVEKVSGMLNLIKAGRYTEAEQLANGVSASDGEDEESGVSEPVETPVASPVAQPTQPVVQPVQPVTAPDDFMSALSKSVENAQIAVSNNKASMGVPAMGVPAVIENVAPPMEALAGFEKADGVVAPPPMFDDVAKKPAGTAPMSFDSIINGTMFKL